MNKLITEKRFNEIKKFLNTPILVKPSNAYMAEEFGYSTGTISLINRSSSYKQYKEHQKRSQRNFVINSIENENNYLRSIGCKAKKAYEQFNNEWFFGGEE